MYKTLKVRSVEIYPYRSIWYVPNQGTDHIILDTEGWKC